MIIGVFGKPRSGKTTFLAMYLSKVLTRQAFAYVPVIGRFVRKSKYFYDIVYSTQEMKGTVLIKPYDVGAFEPIEGKRSLFIIHEAGCDFNNRSFKSIPSYCTDFFAQHGHYNVDIIYDSQTVDIDKKLRNRTAYFYVVSKCPLRRWRSCVTRVKYWIGVNNEAKDLDECYSEPEGLLERFLARLTRQRYTFRRRPYYKFFDSYNRVLVFHGRSPGFDPVSPSPKMMKEKVFYIFKFTLLSVFLISFVVLSFTILLSFFV